MSTSPTIAPQMVSFVAPRRSFVLHNAKPKRIEVMYVGNMMTLPAVNEIHPVKHDTDADGDPIPGTYVVSDLYTFIPELGDEMLTFDSAKAVAHILGLRRNPNGTVTEAASLYAVGGVSLLPRHSTKEQWKEVCASGEHRAWLTRVKNAQLLITEIDEKNAHRKAAGMEAVHGGPEWTKACALIKEYNELVQADVRKEIGASPTVDEKIDDEVEITALVRAKALELSERYGSAMSEEGRKKLFDQLLDDPKIRAHAQKEHRWRKRGHSPIKDEDLAAAAELGQTVSGAGLE